MIEDAIILAGGYGTRLRPLTLERPKPLLPVGNRPFLETQFFRLAEAGVKRVRLSVFHQASRIKSALPKLRKSGLKVSVIVEQKPLGTGGAIRFAWPDPKLPCLVLNGDVLSDFKPAPLVRFHREKKGLATLWLIAVEDTRAFGVAETKAGRILRFVEKPRPGESKSKLINAGLYALGPEVLKYIPKGKAVSVEREVFPALLAGHETVLGYSQPEAPYWNDIGTPAAYLRANLDAAWGRVKLGGFWKGGFKDGVVAGPGSRIHPHARVRNSVLLEGAQVEEGAEMEGVVLGTKARVGPNVHLHPGSVLGSGTHITEWTLLGGYDA